MKTEFASRAALGDALRSRGFELNLKPIRDVYWSQRDYRADALGALLILTPPPLGMFLLGWWIFRLRRSARRAPPSDTQ